ncbi:hypothetical protein ACJO5Y_18255 [Marinobacter sp. GN3S48]|uniref:hypothetical protein n=1 Tax=Marinobacter sp. GN3S48 TaxID=3382302 RepID=UPI00387ABDB3
MSALDFLPPHLAALSISEREIVLSLDAALEAVDYLECHGRQILGWEGWVKTPDGRVGHGSAPQGTVSLEELSIAEAAAVCRATMPEDANSWAAENPTSPESLFFCITVRGQSKCRNR